MSIYRRRKLSADSWRAETRAASLFVPADSLFGELEGDAGRSRGRDGVVRPGFIGQIGGSVQLLAWVSHNPITTWTSPGFRAPCRVGKRSVTHRAARPCGRWVAPTQPFV